MIPIKYVIGGESENGHWEICSPDDSDWYSYTEEDKKWANVMLSDCGINSKNNKKYTRNDIGETVEEKDLGSMFVWIPRYAYKITEGYHTNTDSPKLEIQWLSGTSNEYVDKEGETKVVVKHTDSKAEATKSDKQYIVHPAFTNGAENGYADGEWKAEVTGIWVSKFEAGIGSKKESNDTVSSATVANSNISYPKVDVIYDSNGTTTDNHQYYYPMFKGKQFAYNYINESQCYTLSLALDKSNNPYGLTSLANSHLIKSSEWGAVTYLTISKYGATNGMSDDICKNDVSICSSSSISSSLVKNPNSSTSKWGLCAVTGYSSNNKIHSGDENIIVYDENTGLSDIVGSGDNSYAWNVVDTGKNSGRGTKASTTGNITGIYDIEGCLGSYTAAWVDYGAECANISKYGVAFANPNIELQGSHSTYLATAYKKSEDALRHDFDSSYNSFSDICGDAIYETSYSCGNENAWFRESIEEDETDNEPFFTRGGPWYNLNDRNLNSSCGLFELFDNQGYANFNVGFFSVLVVE